MSLSNSQFEQLQSALLEAFPKPSDLAQMVRKGLNENLEAIVGQGNLSENIFDLITWAVAQGRERALVRAARQANPGNPRLKTFAAEHFLEDDEIQRLEEQIATDQQKLNGYEALMRLEKDLTLRATLEQNSEQIKNTLLSQQATLASRRAKLAAATQSAQPGPLPPAPLPPASFLWNTPYGLESAMVGREQERALLDDWYWRDPAHPLLAVIGLGGQGKSALTWDWMQRLRASATPPPLVIWWSFYESDGTMANLLETLLKHFGDEPTQFPSLRNKSDRVCQHLAQTPALLLLDGAERLLRAYSSLAAAYQGDGAAAESQPNTPHQCVDGVTGQLLIWLADPRLSKARTLLTSRLFPQELSGRGGATLAGVRRLDLPGLAPEAAYELRALHIRASRAEVEAVCAPLGYHPLSLRLLAQSAAADPRYRNDIRAAVNYDPFPDLLGKRQHVLETVYNSLPASAQHLLGQLATFRSSVAYATLEAIFGDHHHNLATLERRGLLQVSQSPNPKPGLSAAHGSPSQISYDLHPIVRRYAYARLQDAAAIHVLVVTYFEAVPEPEKVQTLDDLLPTIELYHHLVRAQRFDEALVLFRDRLHDPLYYQLGAYQQQIDLLSALFSDGSDQLPRLSKERDQAWTLNSLANGYSLAGQPASAIPHVEMGIAIDERRDDKKNLAIGLGNVAYMAQIHVGALASAAANLRRSIALCQEIEERFDEAIGHQALGRLLALCGDWAGAEEKLETALRQLKEENAIQLQGVGWAYRAEAALLQNRTEAARDAVEEALRMAVETARTSHPYERDYVGCYWLLGWTALANGDFDAAQQHLDEALRRCRAINLVELEAKILLAQARLALAKDEADQAQSPLTEAQTIAERAGYVLDLADIHNLWARLAQAADDKATARKHARQARAYAWCDGPPYTYQTALDEADRLLAELE